MNKLDLRKAPTSPDQLTSSGSSLSSPDDSKATYPSVKPLSAQSDLPRERAILRKSSKQDNIRIVPNHLGLILDGNRRWAVQNNVTSFEGHRKGYENLKTIVMAALDRGVKYVTAYVFSIENWNRNKEEVDYLMKLLLWVATHEVAEMNKKGIRVCFMGSKTRLSKKIIKAIDKAEEKTKDNTKGTLAFCLSYGGQQEIVDAVKDIMSENIQSQDVTAELISSYLYVPDIPPVDLIIRTSGEQRLSDFMLWRASYSELLFAKKFWPDFTEEDLTQAFIEFSKRDRRFGAN